MQAGGLGARIGEMRAQLRIEKLVYGGAGLARYQDAAAFVPLVLPGEEVEAALSPAGTRVLRASDVVWTERSPDRTAPLCPVFGQCGGCHYQHMPYEREVDSKVAILRESLVRLGGLRWEQPIQVVAAEPWAYRNRTQLRLVRRDGECEVGFLAAGSHRHVGTPECAINSPKLAQLHHGLLRMVADRKFPRFVQGVEFFTNESAVQMTVRGPARPLPTRFWSWCAECLEGCRGSSPLDYRCGADLYRVSSRSFFQVNRHLVARLAAAAVGSGQGGLALDLYCGVGLMALPLARQFREVVAVDSGASAIRDLRHNARGAGVAVRAVRMHVRDFLRTFAKRPDRIVADPPRAGLGAAVVKQIVRLRPAELRLVSCDPATLARDLKLLREGGYEVASLTLFDLFPRTYHIETVAVLRRG